MRALLVVILVVGGGVALPRRGRGDGAEVIRIVDEKTPILLSGGESDNSIVPFDLPGKNESAPVGAGSQQPTPVPEDVAITTVKFVASTPDLVPGVVDIATANPGNTPPPPANGTRPPSPPGEEDEEEESDEGSEEEADEEDDGDEEDEEEEEDEEDEEEDDEDAKAKKLLKVRRDAEVAGEEIPEIPQSFKENSEEEDVKVEKVVEKVVEKNVLKAQSKLQAVTGGATGEDDEADSVLLGGGKGAGSVVIS